MLTPEDLKKKTFSKGFRGYETAEVDKFMQELIKEYNYLYLDNLQQKETIERVSSKLEYYQQMEATMQSTLTVAQETADEVKAASEKKGCPFGAGDHSEVRAAASRGQGGCEEAA